MAYIGRDTDKISNVEVLDNITFDGSSSYTLQKGGSNFTPSSANTLLLSIDGVVQAGNFTVSGSTIDFGTAVAGTSTCDFVLHYGVGLITAPSDGTVTTAKLADSSVSLAKLTATGTKDATTFLRGDNSFAVVDTNTVIDLTSDLSGNGFGEMKLKYTEVSVSGTGFVYLGFCRQTTNCGGALGEHGIPLGFIPGVEYNASFTVGDLAVEPWPAGSNRYEYKVNISSFTTAGTLGIIYLGAST